MKSWARNREHGRDTMLPTRLKLSSRNLLRLLMPHRGPHIHNIRAEPIGRGSRIPPDHAHREAIPDYCPRTDRCNRNTSAHLRDILYQRRKQPIPRVLNVLKRFLLDSRIMQTTTRFARTRMPSTTGQMLKRTRKTRMACATAIGSKMVSSLLPANMTI